ncbi:SAM-dependent methyltransferase [Sorangium sp. So ce1036]|uniref:class I SAM-dependent methyltransferase n=1 Tax=Sorangium sp. So ce1036 TaxID=3133328 RepID=UPI003F0B3A1D
MSHERPSRTARKIARLVILIDAVPRLAGLLPEGEAAMVEAILHGSGVVSRREIALMRSPWGRRLYRVSEALTVRGQLVWLGLRKRWVADAVSEAIAAGATQLLVVGAGLDALAALVARRHPGVTCVEIDAPATAEPKRAGLRAAGAERDSLHLCAADLSTRPLAEALRATPWRSDARSVVVAEGLLMYLDAAVVRGLLAAVRGCAGPGSRLAFSSIFADDAGRPRVGGVGVLDRPMRAALRLAGEPMRWGIRPEAVRAFVEPAGYRVLEQPDLAALRRRYLAPLGLADEPVAPYEHLVLAEVAPPA